MEHLILIGHGSPLEEANNLMAVGKLLHSAIHNSCMRECVSVAYLQFGKPDLKECIRTAVSSGAKKIIILPYFLTSGMHVTKDIPQIIEEAKVLYPHVEFIYTEPLGFHERLVEIIKERIKDHLRPHEIEERSFEIIEEEADLKDLPFEEKEVIKRVIHATADLEFKQTMLISPDAIKVGIEAIKAGKDILVDVEMVRVGISKRFLRELGIKVHCYIDDEEVIRLSKATGRTRAEIAIEKALNENNNIGIIAIGNAPTALLKVVELLNHEATSRPQPLVISVPVGFVKALESKVLLSSQEFPFITNLSKKGGSAVAASVVNALLKIASNIRKEEEK